MRENPVKQLLRAGKPAIGAWLTLGDPLATETLAHMAFDWLNVDMEHGSIDVRETRALFQVINTTDVVPTARVPWNDHVWIKRVLDAGAYGVVVPMVRTREEAERAVAACLYPPAGIRSIGSGRNHYAFRTTQAAYLEHANDQLLVIIQIEHADAIRRLDDILSVPGIDAAFIGPNDLCASMGIPPSTDSDHPDFEAAVSQVVTVAQKYGVAPGIHTSSGQALNKRLEQGFRYMGLANDQRFLIKGATDELDVIKREL